MARLVKKECNGPVEIKMDKTRRSIWICMCGLSNNQPFCDNSHKRAEDEEDNKTYAYDKEDNRIEVRDSGIFD